VVRVGIVGARIRTAVASVRMMWVTPFMELYGKGGGIKGAGGQSHFGQGMPKVLTIPAISSRMPRSILKRRKK